MSKRLMAALAGLILLAVLLRRPAETGKTEAARPSKGSRAPDAKVFRPPSLPPKTEGLWGCLKQPDPIRRTAEYLGIERGDAFVAAAQDSVAMLHRARTRRQGELSAPDPAVQISIDSDESYESCRDAALARLESFLDQSERHREFREQVDTWAATVWAATQGVYLPAGPR